MLFNGERIGDGTPPMTDIAVDPIDGTDADGPRAAAAPWPSSPSPSGGRCSTRARASTWRSSPSAPRPPTSIDLDGEPGGEPQRRRAGQGRVGARPHRRRARPRRGTASSSTKVRGDRRPHHAHHRRRRRRRDRDRLARVRRRRALSGIGGTPEGIIAAAALKCMGGEHPGPPLAARRRRAARGERGRLRRRPRARHATTSCRATTAFSPPPGSPGRPAPGRSLRPSRRHDAVARHAVQVRHRAPRRGAPSAVEAARRSRPSSSADTGPMALDGPAAGWTIRAGTSGRVLRAAAPGLLRLQRATGSATSRA